MVTALIATIIHMQMGFEMPEALGRGVVSAILIWGVLWITYFIISLLCNIGRR